VSIGFGKWVGIRAQRRIGSWVDARHCNGWWRLGRHFQQMQYRGQWYRSWPLDRGRQERQYGWVRASVSTEAIQNSDRQLPRHQIRKHGARDIKIKRPSSKTPFFAPFYCQSSERRPNPIFGEAPVASICGFRGRFVPAWQNWSRRK